MPYGITMHNGLSPELHRDAMAKTKYWFIIGNMELKVLSGGHGYPLTDTDIWTKHFLYTGFIVMGKMQLSEPMVAQFADVYASPCQEQ